METNEYQEAYYQVKDDVMGSIPVEFDEEA